MPRFVDQMQQRVVRIKFIPNGTQYVVGWVILSLFAGWFIPGLLLGCVNWAIGDFLKKDGYLRFEIYYLPFKWKNIICFLATKADFPVGSKIILLKFFSFGSLNKSAHIYFKCEKEKQK